MSQELSRSNQCRQLFGYTFYESLRAAAAAAVSVLMMSLPVKGMCTSAVTDCITLNCLIGLNLQLCYWDTSWAALWGKGALHGHAVLEESQCRALFPGIIQHSLEQSLVAICKAPLLAVGGWVLPALTPAPCACAHTGCEGTIRSVIFNSNKAVDLIQSRVQTSENFRTWTWPLNQSFKPCSLAPALWNMDAIKWTATALKFMGIRWLSWIAKLWQRGILLNWHCKD